MTEVLWVFLILMSLQPVMERKLRERARHSLMRRIEKSQGRRLISLIHRQETMSLLGFPLMRYIDVNDSVQVIRAIRLTRDDVPISLLVHSPGGLVLASAQIARALKHHPAHTRVIVPHYAMSGGTLIALAADEIVMDENATLGPVDPQLGQSSAASLLRVLDKKQPKDIDDETLILADQARMAVDQVRLLVEELLSGTVPDERASEVAQQLSEGRWTHDYSITAEAAVELGLPVSTSLPPEFYALMDLYRQPVRNRPSNVEYLQGAMRGGSRGSK